jgi:hypothetical protein
MDWQVHALRSPEKDGVLSNPAPEGVLLLFRWHWENGSCYLGC